MDFVRGLLQQGVDQNTVLHFIGWHKKNPAVWKEFETLALQLWHKGAMHYGAKAIFEIIRYKRRVEKNEDFKCNNNYAAYYARIFALKYPKLKNFFEFREVKGLSEAQQITMY